MELNLNIKQNLTPEENELFFMLTGACKKVAPSVTLRVAGGWVRDKLLGKNPDDIDIMVDKVSGEKIAHLITSYLGLNEPHVVNANPDASKHLETAGVQIPLASGKAFDIDFAQARQEIYHDDSRIPDIKLATPQEDALRRDLTINSLFYNIMTEKLEDFTGKGVNDLRNNILRTPQDPQKTFLDDPLRIFRTIRFAARYNGNIDPETYSAMTDPSLRDVIKRKITKERIQEEFYKMLKGPNPQKAIQILKDSGLLQDIIDESIKGTEFENKLAPFDMDQNNPHHELTVWDHTMQTILNILDLYKDADSERRAIMVLSALLHDLGKLYYDIHVQKEDRTSYHGHEDVSSKLAELILQYLKFNKKMSQNVVNLISEHMRPHVIEQDLEKFYGTDNAKQEKSIKTRIRALIRKLGEKDLEWIDVLNHSIADAYSKGLNIDPNTISRYQNLASMFHQAINETPAQTTKVPPILNGFEVMEALKDLNVRQGPVIGEAMEFLKELQDENPNITKPEATQALIREFYNRLSHNKNIVASTCPKHLSISRMEKVFEAMDDKKYFKAINLMKQLKEEYPNDINLGEQMAACMFRIIIADTQIKDVNLINYLFTLTEDNFFNTDLCIPVISIALILKTGTSETILEEMCERMSNMAPNDFLRTLKRLPKNSVHKNLIKKFKGKLNG